MSTTYNLSDINCSPAKCSSCWMRFYVAILVLPGRVVEIWTWAGFKVAVGFILTVLHSHCDRINIILKQTNLRRLWNLILPVTHGRVHIRQATVLGINSIQVYKVSIGIRYGTRNASSSIIHRYRCYNSYILLLKLVTYRPVYLNTGNLTEPTTSKVVVDLVINLP